ncbi:MAG: DnaJ domain-containing protein [Gammaproteobacteria bacterium]|nr:DnaJ domain-containing protein [Gammaproteobacteria bacterium]
MQHALMIESLQFSIEQILLQHPQGLSEYELITALQSASDHEISSLQLHDPHQLFQMHFMLFHCLYLLRDRWLAEKLSCLQISALKIIKLAYTQSHNDALELQDSVRQYYLDVNNLTATDADAVETLISRFWHKFACAPELEHALMVFELSGNLDFKQIKARYQQLAMQNHPDRGGSDSRLAEINQAMKVLKGYYQPKK